MGSDGRSGEESDDGSAVEGRNNRGFSRRPSEVEGSEIQSLI
jgi:hypothetical protein